MLARDYDLDCSIARTLELIGERWTLLVIRDIFLGQRRFDQIQDSLGVARNVLSTGSSASSTRASSRSAPTSERPQRYEYFLTEKGLDLWPVLVALMRLGRPHLRRGAEGPPMAIVHKDCGGARQRPPHLRALRRASSRCATPAPCTCASRPPIALDTRSGSDSFTARPGTRAERGKEM